MRPGGPASPLAPADPAGPCAPAIALRSSGTGVIPGDQTLALLTNTGLQRIEQRHYVLALHSDGGHTPRDDSACSWDRGVRDGRYQTDANPDRRAGDEPAQVVKHAK